MAATDRPANDDAPLALVTGACGFMGTHVCEVLAEAGHRIRATDLDAACGADDRERGRFPEAVRATGAELVPADVTRPETLAGLLDGVDHVFHIAAVFNDAVPFSVLEAVNVRGTRNLLDAVLAARADGRCALRRIVVWGAGGVYGFPTPGVPIREDTPSNPPNDYLRSKTLQEELVMDDGRERDLDWTIIRPTAVYGPRAVGAGGRAYNVSDDSRISTREFLRYVAELNGSPFLSLPAVPIRPLRSILKVVGHAAERANRSLGTSIPLESDTAEFVEQDVLYDTTRLKETGFSFTYPEAWEGIRDTLTWYRDAGWL